jgi:hypothetical protein
MDSRGAVAVSADGRPAARTSLQKGPSGQGGAGRFGVLRYAQDDSKNKGGVIYTYRLPLQAVGARSFVRRNHEQNRRADALVFG